VEVSQGSLLRRLPSQPLADEMVESLVERAGFRMERIVSTGQATPEGEWFDQENDEWVLLVSGRARLKIEGEAFDRDVERGDFILLPAHCRHRVTWTEPERPTVWLAIHFAASGSRT
jgi:cupin 2 domain-containing protein